MKEKQMTVSSSRKKTPWDEKDDLTPTESFIKSNYQSHYDEKHPRLGETNEADLINSYPVTECPCCTSCRFIRNGYDSNGIQMYRCKDCGRKFTRLTGTIFQDHKISVTEWIEYCLDLMGYSSLNATSMNNKNSSTTSKYWMEKIFLLLRSVSDSLALSGTVYIDEKMYRVVKHELIEVDGHKLRGISRNQYCIGIGYDGHITFCQVEGTGKTSIPKTWAAFGSRIVPGSKLIHDKEKSHIALTKRLNLTSIAYDSKSLRGLPDNENPLNPINKQCFMLERFLDTHQGFNRDELQDYCNLFMFIMNQPSNKLEKVKVLLDSAMTSAVTLKFRACFKANSDD